ncbi:hypothetical protein BLNAU_24315 [Blattamonas nauphoetae]|uniref:Uncharacterized protein n=1 Tax=Blattamonas nauphoetae TaxID=2049346 RepID=A0ABQ9WMS4_9EUKA|nr:hypothetical protein BLNAU_24315 [Blattamonas nauphoetae]
MNAFPTWILPTGRQTNQGRLLQYQTKTEMAMIQAPNSEALLRQMESPDIDYKIQKLHVNMSMCVLSKEEYAAELRDQKREKWEREQKVREHQKRGYSPQQTLGPLRVERIHRQDRQPHGEGHAIRSCAASMEERKTVANAQNGQNGGRTQNIEMSLLNKQQPGKRMKAQEEARIREAERRKEGATWGNDLRTEAEEAKRRERGRDGRNEEGERRERKGDGQGERRSRSEGGREGVSIPLPVPNALVNDAPNSFTARANTRPIDARHTNNGAENRKIRLDRTAYSRQPRT